MDTGLCAKIVKALYKFMTLTVYIRLVLENLQFIFLCTISEANRFDSSSNNKKASLLITYSLIAICFIFYIFIIYEFCVTRKRLSRSTHFYSRELFAGLKGNNKARLYTTLLVSRRLVLCIILICLQDLNKAYCILSFFLIQMSFLVVMIWIRPFDETTNNVVEIVNELLLAILISMLLYYNESSRWNTVAEDLFLYAIVSNSVSVSLITTVSFIGNVA